ncbi:MAG: glycosyltransferase [Pyrinomonadaceae bacterium]|nr:glycosyltransferase [Pyrinomonadaceae bacterium]
MKVLALASYPIEAAATRYRLYQFVAPLAERGITLEIRPLLNAQLFAALYRREEMPRTAAGLLAAALRRFGDVIEAREADVLLVQREAMMFGPPVVEWLATRVGQCPMVLDLDDATYVPYTSPTYGRLGSALKWFSKTDDLIRWAKVVTCGNPLIAEYVRSKGARAVVIPTVVDTTLFRPRPEGASEREVLTLGWIGTHSTYPFLESLFPVLQRLAGVHRFGLKVIGAGRNDVSVPGVEVENLDWSLQREIADFQSFDIGLYPIVIGGSSPREWAAGKSGFKSVQYMSVGIPHVMTPVGVCADIGEPGVTHFCATSPDEWFNALTTLLSDAGLRRQMGEAGRRHALQHYTVPAQAEKLARALREAASGERQK